MAIEINNNISSASLRGSSNTLNDDQVNTVVSILDEYDAESLTESDAKAIVQAFRGAGIRPSGDLKDLMAQAGFDARDVGELSGIAGQKRGDGLPPSKTDGQAGVNQEALQTLQSILEQYQDLTALNEAQQQQLNSSLYDAGLLDPGALISALS